MRFLEIRFTVEQVEDAYIWQKRRIRSCFRAASLGPVPPSFNCGGEDMIVEGENLDTATQIEMLDEEGNVFHTATATYADGKLRTGYIYLDTHPTEGSVRVTTAGGSATYEVEYDHH